LGGPARALTVSMLDRVRASMPALPPAEQRVAKLLLADARSFATLPISELADRAHVSKPDRKSVV
jgi:RpiR family carbohydrate utilization transcriptional regulator